MNSGARITEMLNSSKDHSLKHALHLQVDAALRACSNETQYAKNSSLFMTNRIPQLEAFRDDITFLILNGSEKGVLCRLRSPRKRGCLRLFNQLGKTANPPQADRQRLPSFLSAPGITQAGPILFGLVFSYGQTK